MNMGYTASEKMLQRVSGKKDACTGDFVEGIPDFLMFHTTLGDSSIMASLSKEKVFDSDKVGLFLGHHYFLPSNDNDAAVQAAVRSYAKQVGVKYICDVGTGMCHFLMPEQGLVAPGYVVAGNDSHTTSYGGVGSYSIAVSNADGAIATATGRMWFQVPKTIRISVKGKLSKGTSIRDVCHLVIRELTPAVGAGFTTLEWAGRVVETASLQERWILGAWAYEMGAGACYVAPNKEVIDYYNLRAKRPFTPVYNDADAVIAKEYEVDITDMGPLVAAPFQPSNVKSLDEVEGTHVDQAYVGGCTGGNIESFRQAAEVLRGRKVHPEARLIIVPGTRDIGAQMMKEGLTEIFYEAGAVILPAYCGPCQMMCVGNIAGSIAGRGGVDSAKPEVMIGTHPRNYPGRFADGGEVYLASPYTAAASAIEGAIADPRKYLSS
jgi:homoaconitase/3-isopropylmalate dehydratase large subunit